MSSKRNEILQYLKNTVLANITTGNGYNFTLATKERGLKHYQDLVDSEFPAVFIASADEDRKNASTKNFTSVMTVYFIGYVKADTAFTVQQELDKLIEDLTNALYDGATVGASDPTHGGKVSWTDVKKVETDEGDNEPHAMFKMLVEFGYKRTGTSS